MLYDRIVDNKEVGRKIWKICTAFNNDLYSAERFVLRWMICTTLNDLYYVEWFVLRWKICTRLNDFYYVEWFVLRWMICITLNDLYYVRWVTCTTLNNLNYVAWLVQRWMICTTLNDFLLPCKICATSKDLYSVDRFALRWMIRSAMDDLYNVESLGLRWTTEYRLFKECQVCLLEKCCKTFFTNLWVDFSWFGNIKKKYFRLCPHKLVIKRCFWFLITLVETIINVFSRHV